MFLPRVSQESLGFSGLLEQPNSWNVLRLLKEDVYGQGWLTLAMDFSGTSGNLCASRFTILAVTARWWSA